MNPVYDPKGRAVIYRWRYPHGAVGDPEGHKRTGFVKRTDAKTGTKRAWQAHVDGHPHVLGFGHTKDVAVYEVEQKVYGWVPS